MSDYDKKIIEILSETRTPLQIWEFLNSDKLGYALYNYRKWFLKRKNINSYKKTNKNTPENLDKLLNSFDRKIKNIAIFTDEVKKEYYKGLKKTIQSYENKELHCYNRKIKD